MSGGMSRLRDSDRSPIPPIEIGSFTAIRPDKSEFMGSASGVFFVNTVFRAFATTAAPPDAQAEEHPIGPSAPDPGSAHTYLAEDDGALPQVIADDAIQNAASINEEAETPGLSYGVPTPGLGRPPPLDTTKRLIMLYFRNWHPFFPFLHGPTFVDEVHRFYNKDPGLDGGGDTNIHANLRRRLCRSVTLQCVLNIAALSQDSIRLEIGSRIQSAVALTSLLGTISGTNDISSLQALLAAELYLTCSMSLRAASTINGALTRMLYHSGFHRCPFRFVQLPQTMYDIRKRIFWCAYVLDRQLSQALGHPVAISDDEVDVCIPSMPELHRPVRPRTRTLQSDVAVADEVHEHLPRDRSGRDRATNETGAQPEKEDRRDEAEESDSQSLAQHHTSPPEAAGEYVLGYLVTYSRLIGIYLGLFHKSIHKRSITWDKVQEITYRTHAWWNSLPSALQGDPNGDSPSSSSHFGAFFTLLYHYLILLINRPFLSLPAHTTDFRSSLQSALSASRFIVALPICHSDYAILRSWPGTLSALWMSGLVIAFASNLQLYPHEKAVVDLNRCLLTIDSLSSRWKSASHCRVALKLLLDRLKFGVTQRQSGQPKRTSSPITDGANVFQNMIPRSSSPDRRYQDVVGEVSSNKRRRYNGPMETYIPPQAHRQGGPSDFSINLESSSVQDWQPVLEYTGPDFGFDADHLANGGDWQAPLIQNIDPPPGLWFNSAGFEAYVQYFGDRLNF